MATGATSGSADAGAAALKAAADEAAAKMLKATIDAIKAKEDADALKRIQ
jgi:hypothetical protein